MKKRQPNVEAGVVTEFTAGTNCNGDLIAHIKFRRTHGQEIEICLPGSNILWLAGQIASVASLYLEKIEG